ncbi:Methionyl-tRNA formyltransferase-like protein 2 [uncultured Candidatus Thioglobus sp.]|nr:Methionyl-tRNA formyltransferase-like protein 2 [uncultured Candidatus Thioglobus sp.]
MNYLVATIKDWHIKEYEKYSNELHGNWSLISNKEELTLKNIQKINPEYIFFPHWSWIVPQEITNNYNCICFHMTDLPYGRGGSPLQNLIINGQKTTKITALKMTQELDAGGVYLKRSLDLAGSAQNIFIRSSKIIATMINEMVKTPIKPKPQVGEITIFKRRTQQQSLIPQKSSLKIMYDYIRMLDADGYPKAFIQYADKRLEFDNAKIVDGKLSANVTMTIINNE